MRNKLLWMNTYLPIILRIKSKLYSSKALCEVTITLLELDLSHLFLYVPTARKYLLCDLQVTSAPSVHVVLTYPGTFLNSHSQGNPFYNTMNKLVFIFMVISWLPKTELGPPSLCSSSKHPMLIAISACTMNKNWLLDYLPH